MLNEIDENWLKDVLANVDESESALAEHIHSNLPQIGVAEALIIITGFREIPENEFEKREAFLNKVLRYL